LLTRTLKLSDGRRLAYAEYGDPHGYPTLYFHGLPGSRLEAALATDTAANARVRLIAIDRPGIGASDRQPNRSLLDWPADVLQLADQLGLARFTVVGVSGGGPYAMACAYSIPERLDAVAIVSGVAPFDETALVGGMFWPIRAAVRSAQLTPSLARLGLRPAVILGWFPHFSIGLLGHTLNRPDRDVLARVEVHRALSRSLAESLRRGARGHTDDLLALTRGWGFRLEDVAKDIYLWHGERDRTLPIGHARYLAAKLPRAHCELVPGEGHFSLVIDRAAQIFSALEAVRREAR
jgi:pimeloyl-ACP methyl ester carboxylesterase